MNSLINNYATGVVVNGVESLFLKKEDAKAVYEEVKTSHGDKQGYNQDARDFEAAWNHFDLNHDGLVEVERIP